MIQNQNEMHSSAKSGMDANMQLTINRFRPVFPYKIFLLTLPMDICLTFSKIPKILLTAVKISDISRFSIQVVIL